MDILTYALAKSYTDKALLGVGTIKGAPCTVKSQTEDDEYVYVTLGWENSLGTPEETVVKIKKGADGAPGEPGPAGDPGPQGVSITKIEKIKTENLIDTYQISFSDNTTFEYTISNGSTDYLNITNKPSIEGVELIGNKTFEDLNIASADALNATDENLQNLSDLIGDKTSLPAPTDTIVNNIASVDAKVDAIIDDNEAGLAKTFSSDKITKTFATIEEANKRIPQYDVLPAPTEAFSGKIVQFIGTTTEDYVHNYFYECVEVESSYKWVNVVVQNVPTKVSELTNDSNFVTETELNEKGYLTEHQDISNKVDKVEGKSLIADTEITRLASVDNYDDTDIKAEIAKKADTTAVPNKVSELTNDSNYQTAEQVSNTVTTEIAKVVADAPESLNTLKEMSDWIAGHEDDASAMNSAISDNKTAITALQTGKADKSEIPTTLPADGGNADTVNRHTVKSDVPENAVFTDTIYDDTEVKESIDELNSNLDGLKFGEVAGGKNICKALDNGVINEITLIKKDVSTIIISGASDSRAISKKFNVKKGVTYTATFFTSSTNVTGFLWNDIKQVNEYAFGISKTITFTPTEDEALIFAVTLTDTVSNVEISMQVEEGSKSTSFEPYIPSVKMLADKVNQQNESLDVIGKCKNLLNPTLQTTTQNGVTCTANGDGTYTFNGTSTSDSWFTLGKAKLYGGRTYRLCGLNRVDNSTMYIQLGSKNIITQYSNNGVDVNITETSEDYLVVAFVPGNVTYNNIIYKPMIIENLDATYDDFVPYTGDGDTLTADVAELNNDLDKLNSLPIGSIIQIEADKDDIETTKQKYGWQYLGTSNIEYESGSANILVTNVYRKNN